MAWPFKSKIEYDKIVQNSIDDLIGKPDKELENLIEELESKVKRRDKFFDISIYTTFGSIALGFLASLNPETKEYSTWITYGVTIPSIIINGGSLFYKWSGERVSERVTLKVSKHILDLRSTMRAKYLNQLDNSIH